MPDSAHSGHSGRVDETLEPSSSPDEGPRPLLRRDFVRLLGGGAVGACLASCPGPDSGSGSGSSSGSSSKGTKGKKGQAGSSSSDKTKPRPTRAPTDKPNIVLFFSDDLGYADVGYHGSKDLRTPHIDSLAKGGVQLSSGYVSAPLCSPSRAGLLTGRYQQRFGHEFNTSKPEHQLTHDLGLPPTEVTLAQTLKGAGYATGIMGKWHQGLQPKYHPQKRGFDEFFGFLHGGHGYTHLEPKGHNPIYRGTTPVAEKEYLTDAISREAVAFVERHRANPFLLYVSYNAPHKPLSAPKRYRNRFADIDDADRRTYAAMISAMDDGIGRVISAVKEAKLEDNTIFIFLNDNGCPPATGDNAPLRGFKYSVYEGGIRVPWTIRWRGRLPAGKTYHKPVISLDIFSTAVAAAGAQPPAGRQLDGVNLLPYLEGSKAGSPHEALYWRVGEKQAIRRGRHKLLRQGDDKPYELYDLDEDRSEEHNLAAAKPELKAKLAKQLEQWSSELAKPLWGPKRKKKGKG